MYPTLVPYVKENSFFAKNHVPSFARYVWYVARIRKDVCRAWREKTIYDSYCSYVCSNRLLVCILLKVLYGRPEIPRYHRTRTLNIPTTNNIMTMDNNNHLHLTGAACSCLSDLVSYCPIGTVLGSDCSPSSCRIYY